VHTGYDDGKLDFTCTNH